MKKAFLFFILHIASVRGFATNYYIDPAGNDNNDGTSTFTAWQTLTKVNNMTFSPGDNILFIKGGAWYGAITVKTNGNSVSQIKWGSYGTGTNPLISGFITTTSWVNAGNGIWTYTNSALGSAIPEIITINGMVQPIGRFPKTNNKYTSHSGTTSITDPSSSNSSSFVGGEVVIRKNHWTLTKGIITSQSSGVINYTAGNTYEATDGYTYFFQNNINCLTQFGDWCYNPSNKTISMFFGTNDPSTSVIKVSNQVALVNFALTYTNSYNSFNGIDFEGGNYAFKGEGSSHNTISNCNINAIGDNAIDFGSSSYTTIVGNKITDVNNTAIVLRNNIHDCIIASNTINRIGVIPGAGESDGGIYGGGTYSGITIGDASSFSNTIQYNNLKNIGYNGIMINGDTYLVDKNYIDSACKVIDDGAGIYTYVGNIPVRYAGRTISNNIVLNSVGVIPPGIYGPPDGLYQLNEAHGIYLDDNSSNITISCNTVANCGGNGYVLHNSHEVIFNNNLGYNNAVAQLIIGYDNNEPELNGINKNLNISNNTLIADPNGQYVLKFQSIATGSSNSDFTKLGIIDNNHYGSLSSNTPVFQTSLNENTNTATNFEGWKSLLSQEANSTFLAPTYISKRFEYNATTQTKPISLDKAFIDIQNTSYTNSVTLKQYSSLVLIDTGVCELGKPFIKAQSPP